jgi:hypothetical protein
MSDEYELVNGAMELMAIGPRRKTQHILCPDGQSLHGYRSDCWCEPRHMFMRDFEIMGEEHKGLWYVILHTGKWNRPYHPPTTFVDKIISTLAEPPEGGWDNAMAKNDVNSLFKEFEGKPTRRRKSVELRQEESESVEAFYERIKDAIEKGADELEFEVDDIDALAGLLERDDDFEVEIDEEE